MVAPCRRALQRLHRSKTQISVPCFSLAKAHYCYHHHYHHHRPSPKVTRSRHATTPSCSRPLTTTVGTQRPPSDPRNLPARGFDVVPQDELFEEENLPDYNPDHFYPARLGELYNDRYQTVAKLGYGSSSTLWLARDLEEHQYVALKIYIRNSVRHRETPLYARVNEVQHSRHPGAGKIRRLLDSFRIQGPKGKHLVLVLQISQMSLQDMDHVFKGGRGFDEAFVKKAIRDLLQAVDYLHTEVQAVHTDIHPGNLLLGLGDNSVLKKMEEAEFANPAPRKTLPDRIIYSSRIMEPEPGPVLLSDFGETRLGPGPHAGDIMPLMYRAPETLLRLPWSYPVDIWSVALTAWDLLEENTLFSARKDNGRLSDGTHFAEMVSTLGPPPRYILDRNLRRALEYWDEMGNWANFVPIPTQKTLESAESKLSDKAKFIGFIRRALTWDPNQRPTAKDLLQDPWLVDL